MSGAVEGMGAWPEVGIVMGVGTRTVVAVYICICTTSIFRLIVCGNLEYCNENIFKTGYTAVLMNRRGGRNGTNAYVAAVGAIKATTCQVGRGAVLTCKLAEPLRSRANTASRHHQYPVRTVSLK
jgi:hypothetical protein